MFFDPMYLLFLAPGIALAIWAQIRVQSAYSAASRFAPRSGYSGAQAAAAMLDAAGVRGVRIEPTEGHLTDHYVPGQAILRLSEGVYGQRNLAALGIAAHEAGHAIQDARRYSLLVWRNALVPMASFGSGSAWLIILAGFLLQMTGLILVGIAVFSLTVVFQLVNLPVEFDASRRARIALVEGGLITQEEDKVVAKVLNAAALTYVAATLTSVLTLLYYLFRAGVFSSRD
ncbi:MAG: zinc metallopeptidase [Gemmataceae bacterium]|nr:zinc metallopeptidase [Gemmataceae bacterium]